MRNTVYIQSIKEWNLDSMLYRLLWKPFKWIGNQFSFFNTRSGAITIFFLFISGVAYLFIQENMLTNVSQVATVAFSILGLVFVLNAFASRGNAMVAWLRITAAQCFVTISIAINEAVPLEQFVFYLSGVAVAGVTGYFCLTKIQQLDNDITLNKFHGYSYEKPAIAFLFLVCCLASLGFPFTPTFLGIDLLFTHIREDQIILIILTSLSFIFNELALLRIYSRVFLGQHKKNYHPIAYRSS